MSTVRRAALAAFAALAIAAPTAAAGNALPMDDARGAIRTATDTWAGLLDGRAQVKRCARTSRRAVRCQVVISGPGGRCEMRVSVVRTSDYDSVRARGVRCEAG